MLKSYLYTETAFHHQGDMAFMKELIDATKDSGASGIKFQVMTRTSDFVSTKHKAFQELNSYCFNLKQWQEIFAYTQEKELDIIMMPLNTEAFDILKDYRVRYLDIHSVSFYDQSLMGMIKQSGIDIILGVGGRTLDEINEKKNYFGSQLKVLMVGFQAFPSKIEEVKIGKIAFLKNEFPNIAIGYADHSAFDNEFAIKSNEYARILGANIFEKHITTHPGKERVDYSAAIDREGIRLILDKINFIDQYILTDSEDSFKFTPAELAYRNRQMRCVAKFDIPSGTILSDNMLSLKMVDDQDDTFSSIDELIGKIVQTSVEKDSVIKLQNIK